MNLIYLADTQIPSRATNGMQVMRMCAAFARNGAKVTLVHPHRFGNTPEGFDGDVCAFYGVANTFRRVTLPTPLTLRLSAFRRFARTMRLIPLAPWLATRSRPHAAPFVVYSRSLAGAWLAIQIRRRWGTRSACRSVVVELHDIPGSRRAWEVVRRADHLVVISRALAERVLRQLPDLAASIRVEHDGVDLGRFVFTGDDRSRVRSELGFDDDVTVVGYTGRVSRGKGADTLLEAAARLSDSSIRFLLVGKVYEGLGARAASIPNVVLRGFVPPAAVPSYVAAMDIVVMPTSAKLPYADFTSPLKLFEYMASGRPIVCADLPVLREVVENESSVLFFSPDDPASLVRAVRRLRQDPALCLALAAGGSDTVTSHGWDARAARILAWIGGAPS